MRPSLLNLLQFKNLNSFPAPTEKSTENKGASNEIALDLQNRAHVLSLPWPSFEYKEEKRHSLLQPPSNGINGYIHSHYRSLNDPQNTWEETNLSDSNLKKPLFQCCNIFFSKNQEGFILK
jgi:hypothetical protein